MFLSLPSPSLTFLFSSSPGVCLSVCLFVFALFCLSARVLLCWVFVCYVWSVVCFVFCLFVCLFACLFAFLLFSFFVCLFVLFWIETLLESFGASRWLETLLAASLFVSLLVG